MPRLFRRVTCAKRIGDALPAPHAHDTNEPSRWISRRKRRDNPKMKNPLRMCMVVLAALLLAAGYTETRAQSAQQTADQAKADANATKPVEKRSADGSPTTNKTKTNNSASTTTPTATNPGSAAAPPAGASAGAASSATPATQKTSPPKNSAMVWVNTESGVYHRPGARWYGRTKQGEYMTELPPSRQAIRLLEKTRSANPRCSIEKERRK
jgi:cytoskeletal protein RodZ